MSADGASGSGGGGGRTAARVALLIGSLLLTFGGLEIALRVQGYDPFESLKTGRELIVRASPHPDVGYELTPHAWGQAWGTSVLVNEHGHRGPAGKPGRHDGYRVAVFGDSITFGNFLPYGATYPAQLQKLLAARDPGYEVLNFGVGGYDVLQNVAAAEWRAREFEPDLIVVGFCLNDIAVMSPNLEYIERAGRYGANPIYRSRAVAFLATRWDRWRLGSWQAHQNELDVFAERYAGRIDPIGEQETELRALMERVGPAEPASWYGDEPRVGRMRHALRRLADLSRREGIDVVTVVFPLLDGRRGAYAHEAAHAIIAAEIRRAGLPEPIDLTAAYYAKPIARLRLNNLDPYHPNAAGHRIAAQQLARRIEALRGAEPNAADVESAEYDESDARRAP